MEPTNLTRPTWLDSSIYPFRDNWMIIEGHTIHYVDEGPRDKPVLFVRPSWSGLELRLPISHTRVESRLSLCRARLSRLRTLPGRQWLRFHIDRTGGGIDQIR